MLSCWVANLVVLLLNVIIIGVYFEVVKKRGLFTGEVVIIIMVFEMEPFLVVTCH